MTVKDCNVSREVLCDKTCLPPKEERKWWYFVITSFSLFLGGLIFIYLTRVIIRLCNSKKRKLNPSDKPGKKGNNEVENKHTHEEEDSFYVRMREKAGTLLTAQTLKGQCFVVISFLFSISYVVLYAVEASYPVEHCLDLNDQILWLFEIGLNTFFILHFLLRFLAANDKLLFWCDPLSLVDFFTIPQVFVSIIIRQNWIGLRFLRALQFIKLADILQFLGIVQTSGAVTLSKAIGNLCAVLFCFGGLVHLLENTGDPWDFELRQDWNYFECLYFLVVTMSTVGYGDMSPITLFGRIFIMIFICIGLGMFATHIPFIMEYFSSHSEYHGSYKIAQGRKHIILCGYITHDTVENFLRDFLHKDRADVIVNVVILGNCLPDPELERMIKKHYVHVSYYIGTVLSAEDCKRVKMSKADACLVLCNKNCSVPDTEDEENIMRVVGIKNFFPKMRVIIQLLQYHNKAYLLNIPSWDSRIGDDVVCVGELKLGFIAQSCLSPGFSTLLANIFSMRSNDMKDDDTTSDDADWRKWYVRGTNCELYTEKLAPSFKSLAFKQVAEICFEKLNLLLIAIEVTKLDGEKTFAINPKDKTLIIQANTLGYFLAGSSQEVKRAYYYCTTCHSNISDPELIKECECVKRRLTALRNFEAVVVATHRIEDDEPKEIIQGRGCVQSKRKDRRSFGPFYRKAEKVGPLSISNKTFQGDEPAPNGHTEGKSARSLRSLVAEALPGLSLGVEGHRTVWNVAVRARTDNLDEENLSRSEGSHQMRLLPHSKKQGSYKVLSKLRAVVDESKKDESQVALLSSTTTKPQSSLKENKPVESFDRSKALFDVTGTFYWCAAVPYEEAILTREKAYDIVFTHHILVCVFNKKDDPLIGLRQLVMPLRASNLQQSDLKHIVFLGDKDYLKREWEHIGSFDNVYILPGSPFCRSDLRAVNSNLADMVVFLSSTTASSSSDPKLADKHPILASLNLKAMSFDDAAGLLRQTTREAFIGLPDVSLGSPNIERRGSAFGCNIPMLTEIVFDHNVQYLDIDDDDDDDMELYLSQPFACGTTFTASVLDSLVSSTYYNGDILTLVRNLVTGGVNPVLEEQLAEGEGLKGGYEVSETSEIRCRCKISQISLYDGPLAEFGNGGQYGEMFQRALRDYSMICLGVYRFRDSNKLSSQPSSKRYVIAVPPYDFLLQSTDLVFVLAHSNEQLNKEFSKD